MMNSKKINDQNQKRRRTPSSISFDDSRKRKIINITDGDNENDNRPTKKRKLYHEETNGDDSENITKEKKTEGKKGKESDDSVSRTDAILLEIKKHPNGITISDALENLRNQVKKGEVLIQGGRDISSDPVYVLQSISKLIRDKIVVFDNYVVSSKELILGYSSKVAHNVKLFLKKNLSEEDVINSTTNNKSLEKQIEEILREEEDKKMSSSQIYKEIVTRFGNSREAIRISFKLIEMTRKSTEQGFGVKRIKMDNKMREIWKEKNNINLNESAATTFLYYFEEEKKTKKKIIIHPFSTSKKQHTPPPPPLRLRSYEHQKPNIGIVESIMTEYSQNLNVLFIPPPPLKINERNKFNILDVIEKSKTTKTQLIEYFDSIKRIYQVKIMKTIEYYPPPENMKEFFPSKIHYLKNLKFKELLKLEEMEENNDKNIHLIYQSFGICGSEISKLKKKEVKLVIEKSLQNILNLLKNGITCFINLSDVYFKLGSNVKSTKVKFLLWNNFKFNNIGENESRDKKLLFTLKRYFNKLFLEIGIIDVFDDENRFHSFQDIFGHVIYQLSTR